MTIDNIAIVRAMGYIPIDGVIKPLSHVPYLCKKSTSDFAFRLNDLLKELNILKPIDYSKTTEEGYFNQISSENTQILEQFLPYGSDYNSMVLFALNGICPDDSEQSFGNNIFSNRNVAVIEPLKPHIDQVISLVPTDTAIKGDVVLSQEAVVLVSESFYSLLTNEQKQMIENSNIRIKLFSGSLKDAIDNELRSSGRYTAEDLSLSVKTGGIKPSETSEELKSCIHNIAESNGLLEEKFFNLINNMDPSMPKYDEIRHEYKNINKINKYYIVKFLEELVTFLGKPDMVPYIAEEYNYPPFLDELMNWIKEAGIENYKQFVDNYNRNLEMEQANMTLPTPDEVIEASKGKSL